MIERTVTVSGEDLRANPDICLQGFLAACSRPRDVLELEVRISLTPGDRPRIEVECDFRVNGTPRSTGPLLQVLRSLRDIPQHGLRQIACGAFYAYDDEGAYPEEFLLQAAWSWPDEEGAALLGLQVEHVAALRALPMEERLAAARRMNPNQNAVWQDRVALAQTAVVLL